ncbi:MAG: serine hydrolase [Pseudomonadota bacterium]
MSLDLAISSAIAIKGRLTLTGRSAVWALFVAIMLAVTPTVANANPKYGGIVIDATSGEVLYASSADKRLYPASLTKMMTLYLTFRAIEDGKLSLGSSVKISRNASNEPPSRLGLRAGDRIKVEQAIYALVVKSANDVATAMGERLGGSEKGFVAMADETARRLDMKNTAFQNAHGLPNRAQVSTPRDMAKLSRALIRDFPQYYHYFSTKRWSFRGTTYRSHNKLLGKYEGMDGLKTGYIRAAGFNLAASAKRGELRLIGVVFGGRTSARRNNHMAKILDRAFRSDRGQFLIANGSIPSMPVPLHRPTSDVLVASVPAPQPRVAAASMAPSGGALRDGLAAAGQAITLLGAPIAAGRPDRPIFTSDGPLPEDVIGLPLPSVRPSASDGTKMVNVPPTGQTTTVAAAAPGVSSIEEILARNSVPFSQIGRDDGTTWSIQLGAFTRPRDAERILTVAQTQVDRLSNARRLLVPNSDGTSDTLFRARLTNMDEQEATKACALLAGISVDCIIIPPASFSG